MNVRTLKRCFNERTDREIGNIFDTVEDRIQNGRVVDIIITPRVELAVRSINASSGQDATSVKANLEPEEQVGTTTSFENVSERNDTLHALNTNDEIRRNISEEVSELLVPGTHFDRQLHTRHNLD